MLSSLFKILKKELLVLSLFHHNYSSLALFGLFLQELQAKKAAKTAQKVQVNYGYGETKRESLAGNSNRRFFLNYELRLTGFQFGLYLSILLASVSCQGEILEQKVGSPIAF